MHTGLVVKHNSKLNVRDEILGLHASTFLEALDILEFRQNNIFGDIPLKSSQVQVLTTHHELFTIYYTSATELIVCYH